MSTTTGETAAALVGACANLGSNLHWLILETGANQSFIFATNKQRINVGASELVSRAGTTWVDTAISDVLAASPDRTVVTPVVRASGKAILLVRSPDVGRAIIKAATTMALTQAPGLEYWGTVEPNPMAGDGTDAADALTQAYQRHAAWRAQLLSTLARQPVLPPVRTCDISGAAATQVRREAGTDLRVSSAAAACWDAGQAGRNRMAKAVTFGIVPDLKGPDSELGHNGWVAVMHADGNRVGEIFLNLGKKIGDTAPYQGWEFVRRLAEFSAALDKVTRNAFYAASNLVEAETAQDEKAREGEENAQPATVKPWLLPLIVGGDDVTGLIDARYALELTRVFLATFEEFSAADPVIQEVTAKVREALHPDSTVADRTGLTASAGLAYVKPHHPFSDAYRLTEELITSAKKTSVGPKGTTALDFYASYDSVTSPLSTTRRHLTSSDANGSTLRLWSGPHLITPADTSDTHALRQLADSAKLTHGYDPLHRKETPKPAAISRKAAHDLRAALISGGAEIDRVRDRITAVAGSDARDALEASLIVTDADASKFSRLLDAMSLIDVTVGTTEGNK